MIAADSIGLGNEFLEVGLGAGVVFGKVTLDIVNKILNHIKFQNTMDDHTIRKDHDFNDYCGPDCIMEVEKNVKEVVKSGFDKKQKTGNILIRGNCKHGCDIYIKLALPPVWEFWDISTAYHKGPCYAKKNLFT